MTRTNNLGTVQAIAEASAAGAAVVRGKRLPADQIERRRRTARELNLGRHLKLGYHGPLWTPEMVAMLGTLPDVEVARRLGKSVNAVRLKRGKVRIPRCVDVRRAKDRERWKIVDA